MPKAVQVSTCFLLSLAMLSAFPALILCQGWVMLSSQLCGPACTGWVCGDLAAPPANPLSQGLCDSQGDSRVAESKAEPAVPVSAAEELTCLVGTFVRPKGCRRLEGSQFYHLWREVKHLPAKGSFSYLLLQPRAGELCPLTEPPCLRRELCTGKTHPPQSEYCWK